MRTAIRIAALLCVLACSAHAQTIVQTIPQSTRQRAFTNQAAPATFTVRNIGQTVHYVTYDNSAGVSAIRMRLEASNNGTTWFSISDETIDFCLGGGTCAPALVASGNFPVMRVNLVEISGGTVTVDYIGSSDEGTLAGVFNRSMQYRRVHLNNFSLGQTSVTSIFFPPDGISGGLIYLKYAGTPGGTTVVTVEAGASQTTLNAIFSATAANNTQTQTFRVPAVPASAVGLIVICSGGGCVGNPAITVTYQFDTPGSANVWTNVPSSTGSGISGAGELQFNCPNQAPIILTATGNTQVIAAGGVGSGIRIRICHISFSLNTAVDVKLVQGTGSNCGTSPVDLTGVYQNIINFNLGFGNEGALRVGQERALCINLSAVATGGGVITYAIF